VPALRDRRDLVQRARADTLVPPNFSTIHGDVAAKDNAGIHCIARISFILNASIESGSPCARHPHGCAEVRRHQRVRAQRLGQDHGESRSAGTRKDGAC